MFDLLKSVNPHTGETLATYPQHSDETVNRHLERAGKRFELWEALPLSERINWVVKLGEALKESKRDLAVLATSEMGKPLSQAVAEVEKCAWLCEHYAENAAAYLKPEHISTDARKSWVAHEPLGVILGVMPWNFPYWQVIRFAVPTLLAGNTTVVKHASNTTGCATALKAIFTKAGFPEGVYETLVVESNRVGDIIGKDAIRGVSLTGSEKAGKSVAAAAGKHLKKSLLELGGSNAFIESGSSAKPSPSCTSCRCPSTLSALDTACILMRASRYSVAVASCSAGDIERSIVMHGRSSRLLTGIFS